MSRVPAELREQILAYWRGHSEAWKLSGLSQQEYCARHNISLKNFGNWRAQLKRIALAGPKARWGHYPRLRRTPSDPSHVVNHVAKAGVNHMAKKPEPTGIPPPGGRRQFSEELKQRIVTETWKPGGSVSQTARRYGLDRRLLIRWRKAFGGELLMGGQP
ncbi:MAG: transposase [Rhodospirillaceae bacterium]|nr:transposase [Rhodospirillaceae bacterium]